MAQPLVRVGLSHHSKFFYQQLLRKVNFVELPKATLIFNYAINVGLPPQIAVRLAVTALPWL